MAELLDRAAKRMSYIYIYYIIPILGQLYDKWEKRILGEKGLCFLCSAEVKSPGYLSSRSRSAIISRGTSGWMVAFASVSHHHLWGMDSNSPNIVIPDDV